MNRLTVIFLALLGLATLLLLGQIWSRAEELLNGQGTPADTAVVVLSTTFFIPVFAVLGRILYLNARFAKAATQQARKEL